MVVLQEILWFVLISTLKIVGSQFKYCHWNFLQYPPQAFWNGILDDQVVHLLVFTYCHITLFLTPNFIWTKECYAMYVLQFNVFSQVCGNWPFNVILWLLFVHIKYLKTNQGVGRANSLYLILRESKKQGFSLRPCPKDIVKVLHNLHQSTWQRC